MAQQLGEPAVLPKKQSMVLSLLPAGWPLSLTLAQRSLTPSSGFHRLSHTCGVDTQAYVHEHEFKNKSKPPKAILFLWKEWGRFGQVVLDLGRRSLWSIIEDSSLYSSSVIRDQSQRAIVSHGSPSHGKINLLYASRLHKNWINDYGLRLKIQWSLLREEQTTKARGAMNPPSEELCTCTESVRTNSGHSLFPCLEFGQLPVECKIHSRSPKMLKLLENVYLIIKAVWGMFVELCSGRNGKIQTIRKIFFLSYFLRNST